MLINDSDLDAYVVSPAEQMARARALKAKFRHTPAVQFRMPAAPPPPQPKKPRAPYGSGPKRVRDPQHDDAIFDMSRPIDRALFGCSKLWRFEPDRTFHGCPLLTGDGIVWFVARRLGVRAGDIFGKSRSQLIGLARHVAMWMVHTKLKWSLVELGRYFGRDHTTVLHGLRQVSRGIADGSRLGTVTEAALWEYDDARRKASRREPRSTDVEQTLKDGGAS